jgi:hypothetical protein
MVQRYDFRGFTDRAQNGSITPILLFKITIQGTKSKLNSKYSRSSGLEEYWIMSVSGEEESGSGSEGSFEEEDYELVEGIGGASSEEEDGDEDVQVENEDNETIGLEEEGDEDGEPAEGEGSDSGSDVEEEESEDEDGDDTFQTLTKEDTRLEIEKGQAVQHQLRKPGFQIQYKLSFKFLISYLYSN